MASRREQKEQARAQREATERRDVAAAQRARRLRTLGAVLALAVVVVIVAIVVSSGGSTKKGLSSGSKAGAVTAAVSAELQGIPQAGTRLGQPGAPVTMDYYGDLQCPVCAAFTTGALATAISREVRGGKLQVVYRSLQTATQSPQVFAEQQTAALAAGRQDRLWQFAELFYRQQGEEGSGYVTPDFIAGVARQTPGLDLGAWSAARARPALRAQLAADAAAARRVGATGTPTLVVHGPKGTRQLSGDPPYATLAKAIAAVAG